MRIALLLGLAAAWGGATPQSPAPPVANRELAIVSAHVDVAVTKVVAAQTAADRQVATAELNARGVVSSSSGSGPAIQLSFSFDARVGG